MTAPEPQIPMKSYIPNLLNIPSILPPILHKQHYVVKHNTVLLVFNGYNKNEYADPSLFQLIFEKA